MTEFHCITQCYFRREHEAKRYLFHVSSHRRTCDRIRAVKVDKCLSASAPRRLIDPSRTCFHLRGLPAHASRSALLLVRRLYFAASEVTRCALQVVIQRCFITFFRGSPARLREDATRAKPPATPPARRRRQRYLLHSSSSSA